MKKFLGMMAVLVIVSAAGLYGYRYYRSGQGAGAQAGAQSAYSEYTVGRGSLSKTVTGTGTLTIGKTRDIALDYPVTVTKALAEAGDTVAAGQELLTIDADALQTAIEALEAELETTESEIASLAESYSSTAYVKMPQYGRVKEVYISPGQYVQDVMEERGCIALLSLDGWMYVNIPAEEEWTIGETLKVKVDRVTLDATVRKLEGGVATATFSDAYGAEGGEVEVLYKNKSLGTAVAHIHMPYELATAKQGYIDSVYIEANDRKWEGNRVCYLINVPVGASYEALIGRRDRQAEQLKEMRALRLAGAITAPEDGIVASIAEASAAEQAASALLASLYVGDDKEMVVSVDELDIISVKAGQSVTLAMDAITDKAYTGTVAKVSQIGAASGGVTVYDVTLSVDGDSQLKLGMNGTATILVEERADALLVPIAALNTSRGASYVWLKSDGADSGEPGERAAVETGLSDENYAEVVSGLSEGDVVLVARETGVSTTESRRKDQGGGMPQDMGGIALPGGGRPSGN